MGGDTQCNIACGIMLAEQNRSYPVIFSLSYAAPGSADDTADLTGCSDYSGYIILPTNASLIQTDGFGRPFGDECGITSTFAEFCEAIVRCRFTQTEFRAAAVDLCSADYDQGLLIFNYMCFPGKRKTSRVLSFVWSHCLFLQFDICESMTKIA